MSHQASGWHGQASLAYVSSVCRWRCGGAAPEPEGLTYLSPGRSPGFGGARTREPCKGDIAIRYSAPTGLGLIGPPSSAIGHQGLASLGVLRCAVAATRRLTLHRRRGHGDDGGHDSRRGIQEKEFDRAQDRGQTRISTRVGGPGPMRPHCRESRDETPQRKTPRQLPFSAGRLEPAR